MRLSKKSQDRPRYFNTQLGPDDIPALGMRVLKEELEFNRKAGFGNKADRLLEFFYNEPLPPYNKTILISDEEMDAIFNF